MNEPANTQSELRDRIAAAIYERNNPGHRWSDAHPDDLLAYGGDADAVLAVRDGQRKPISAPSTVSDSPGYCPHCGRGDCAPTADEYQALRQRLHELSSTLDEVLRQFVHKGHPGEPCLQTGWIVERTVARWRAVLYPPVTQEQP